MSPRMRGYFKLQFPRRRLRRHVTCRERDQESDRRDTFSECRMEPRLKRLVVRNNRTPKVMPPPLEQGKVSLSFDNVLVQGKRRVKHEMKIKILIAAGGTGGHI